MASIDLLGMAKKAGRIEIGEDCCSSAARAGKARLILSAKDASENSLRRAKALSDEWNITYVLLPYDKYEIGNMVGRGSPGTLAITDIGLASSFINRLAAEHPEEYDEIAAVLEKKRIRAIERKRARCGQDTGTGKRRKTI